MRKVELNLMVTMMRFSIRSYGQRNLGSRYLKLVGEEPSKAGPTLNKTTAVFSAFDRPRTALFFRREALQVGGFERLRVKGDPRKAKR